MSTGYTTDRAVLKIAFFLELTMEKEKLTQERLKEVLHYASETGVFTWKKVRSNRVRKDRRAGTLSWGYVTIKISGRYYRGSQLAFLYMTGSIPKLIDHINRDRSDDRWNNLRAADRSINARNRITNSPSGITGVYYRNDRKKWTAFIKYGSKYQYYGCYYDKHSAIMARYSAELEHGWHLDEIYTEAKQYVNEYFGRLK